MAFWSAQNDSFMDSDRWGGTACGVLTAASRPRVLMLEQALRLQDSRVRWQKVASSESNYKSLVLRVKTSTPALPGNRPRTPGSCYSPLKMERVRLLPDFSLSSFPLKVTSSNFISFFVNLKMKGPAWAVWAMQCVPLHSRWETQTCCLNARQPHSEAQRRE